MGKTTVMRITRQPFPIKIMVDKKQLKNVEYFKYLGSMVTNDKNLNVKLNSVLQWQKQHSTRRRLFAPAKRT